tara:strand:- start:238 stop:1017 length:780 start_codon:yes stop_codon:yes gene_type:complete
MMDIINNIADELASGETKRMNCPNCGGYKTFTITNNVGQLLWNCYKASCKVSGSTRTTLSVADIRNYFNLVQQDDNKFNLPDYVVHHTGRQEVKEFAHKYGINYESIPLYFDVKEKRIVFPIRDKGIIVDAVGRATSKFTNPKWKRYGNSNVPFSIGTGNVAVVVEDCVSASVLDSEGCVGVALLGTSLSQQHREHLQQFSTVIIALDPDASYKSFSIMKELRSYVNEVLVLKLEDDLKYRRENDLTKLKELLNGTIVN